MAVPTVSTLTPNTGLTGGRLLVRVSGTNFQLPPAPPSSGIAPVPKPSVEVLFGGVKARHVVVLSSTLLHVLTPICGLVDSRGAPATGPVSVTVRNVDQNGAVVPGETVTLANAFTYTRPVLETSPAGGGTTRAERDLVRLVRAFIRELKRQVIPNVELTVHTDYAESPTGRASIAMLSSLPGLVLVGPRTAQNRFFSLNARRYTPLGGGVFAEQRTPYTIDLGFQILGVDDSSIRLLNLQAELIAFFQRNKTLSMPCDPAQPQLGDVSYEMDFETSEALPDMSSPSPGNSNIRTFRMECIIRGLDIDDLDVTISETRELVDTVPVGATPEQLPSPILLGGTISAGGPGDPPAGTPVEPAASVGSGGLVVQFYPPEE